MEKPAPPEHASSKSSSSLHDNKCDQDYSDGDGHSGDRGSERIQEAPREALYSTPPPKFTTDPGDAGERHLAFEDQQRPTMSNISVHDSVCGDDDGADTTGNALSPVLAPRIFTASSISDIDLDVNLDLKTIASHNSTGASSTQTTHYFGDDERGDVKETVVRLELPDSGIDITSLVEQQQPPQGPPQTPQQANRLTPVKVPKADSSTAYPQQRSSFTSQSSQTIIPGLFTLYKESAVESDVGTVEVLSVPGVEMTEEGYAADADADTSDDAISFAGLKAGSSLDIAVPSSTTSICDSRARVAGADPVQPSEHAEVVPPDTAVIERPDPLASRTHCDMDEVDETHSKTDFEPPTDNGAGASWSRELQSDSSITTDKATAGMDQSGPEVKVDETEQAKPPSSSSGAPSWKKALLDPNEMTDAQLRKFFTARSNEPNLFASPYYEIDVWLGACSSSSSPSSSPRRTTEPELERNSESENIGSDSSDREACTDQGETAANPPAPVKMEDLSWPSVSAFSTSTKAHGHGAVAAEEPVSLGALDEVNRRWSYDAIVMEVLGRNDPGIMQRPRRGTW
ncbi:hypothetical protein MFIFM68171_09491 [Madurella fahalii]|uniref:Uncharacterized protein n=1 Tax=Madurella fahalii TaxID=1157608 RepID=A0ABQ0GNH5_9PEZI